MKSDVRSRGVALKAAAIGLTVGGVGTQLLVPLLREIDPLGLTPIAVVSGVGGAALGWYFRGCAPPNGEAAARDSA